MKKIIAVSLLALVACGRQEYEAPAQQPSSSEVDSLREQVFALQGTVSQINSLVLSDWASCSTGGADTLTTLQQNMCRIAQAATVEARVKLRGEVAALVSSLEREVQDLQTALDSVASSADLNQVKTDLYGSTSATCVAPIAGSVCARLNSAESRLTSLENTVNNPTTGVAALNTAVANINSQLSAVINGAMIEITVGDENLAEGPYFESLLRNPARDRLVAYVDAMDANKAISNNGVSTTNGSATVTVTATSHGYSVGNVVKLSGLTGTGGLTAANLNDRFVVASVPNANTFTFTASTNASSNASGGGLAGYVNRINGQGLGRAWSAADGEQTYQTTFSLKPYTFLVTGASTTFTASPDTPLPSGWAGLTPGTGFVCWSKTSRTASASTIKAGGSSIRCR